MYFDDAATSRPVDGVLKEITPFIERNWHNPSAKYKSGEDIKKVVEDIRIKISKIINCFGTEVFFTSGATESNNWVIRGFDDANHLNQSVIITTPIEHSSIIEAISNPALRSEIHFCKVDSCGCVDMKSLEYLLGLTNRKRVLVSISMANNEIGTIQDIQKISEMVHRYNGYLHVDATQTFGKIPIDVKKLNIDLLSASAHKIGGIKGVGILYKKHKTHLYPLIYGEQENKNRGGTENVIGIIALGAALDVIDYKLYASLIDKRDYMIKNLLDMGCKLNGGQERRLPNNINVMLPDGISGESFMYLLDIYGIEISTGSACNSNSIIGSYVLQSIGLNQKEVARSIRITLPQSITLEEIDCALDKISTAIKQIRRKEEF